MTAGIVCEYNPFHNGHLYHIAETRKAGADAVVCVMSGNFVQRGECAVTDKWQRAKAAVAGGADIVIDLPVPWSTGSAESFARGSIYLLSCFGIDTLSFGCETNDRELLKLCARNSEGEEIAAALKKYISQGCSYPTAFSCAMGELYGERVKEVLSLPNSTLAVEYIKQLNLYLPECEILPVKRLGVNHDSDSVSGAFASASKIREIFGTEESRAFLPESFLSVYDDICESGFAPCRMKNAERAILSGLRNIPKGEYSRYVTDESGLAARIYESARTATSLEMLYENAKSRNYTYARVRREVMALYLGIEKDMEKKLPTYIRVLAASERGLSLLSRAKSTLPVITKHSEAEFDDEFSKRVYELQCSSTDKFALMSPVIRPCGLEQRNAMYVLK